MRFAFQIVGKIKLFIEQKSEVEFLSIGLHLYHQKKFTRTTEKKKKKKDERVRNRGSGTLCCIIKRVCTIMSHVLTTF